MTLAFLTNKVSFFELNIKYFDFLTQIRNKYVIFVIPTKNKVFCYSISFLLLKFSVNQYLCRF